MGRIDLMAGGCAEALAGFEAIGDRWGMALALVGQAELDDALALTEETTRTAPEG
jgi:hypothetical protein